MNIENIRKNTIGCHNKLFFNSAGASLMPNIVVEQMNSYLALEQNFGGYAVNNIKSNEIEKFYIETAKLLNTKPNNIAFANSATDAFSRALSSITFQAGDCIITSDDDYVSNQFAFFSLRNRYKIQLIRTQNLENGDIDLADFEQKVVQYHPKLVAITHIPTNTSKIQDVVSIGKICNKYGTLYLVDACQSVGHMPVDVQEIGCDFLSATGRKFLRGPRGTGFLYISDKVLQADMTPIYIDLKGADWQTPEEYVPLKTATRFENFEAPYESLVGLGFAIEYANNIGLENIFQYNQLLTNELRALLSEIEGVTLYDFGSNLANFVTFHHSKVSLESLLNYLNQNQVFCSFSQPRNALIDFEKKGVEWVVRLSPHYFNTMDEIKSVAEIIKSV